MKSLKSFAGFPREQIERSIVERFETIAQHYADRVALTDRGQCWTYDELNRAANRIAHAILERRDVSDETIPLLLPQSAAAVISALGVIKARKAYCALAPSHPGPRLNHILQELRSELVVTNAENAALARKLGSGSDIVFCRHTGRWAARRKPAHRVRTVACSNILYVRLDGTAQRSPAHRVHDTASRLAGNGCQSHLPARSDLVALFAQL